MKIDIAFFGSLAIIIVGIILDPWLCVTGFRRVCLYRMLFIIYNDTHTWFINRIIKTYLMSLWIKLTSEFSIGNPLFLIRD